MSILLNVEQPKLKHLFTCIISGHTASGKSSFCIRLLKTLDYSCTEKIFDGVYVWCFSDKAAVPLQQFAVLGKKIRYHEGVSEEEFGDTQGRLCLILDDLLNHVYSEKVCDVFTKGSHHILVSS